MGELLSELDAGVVLGTIGVLVGVVGILLFLRSRKRMEPTWTSLGTTLVSTAAGEYQERLKVTFDGRQVSQVTVTRVYFWNEGNEIIDRADLATVDPLRLVLTEEDSRLLACRVVGQQRVVVNATNPEVGSDGREAVVAFDFLEQGDGFAVDVVHTASRPEAVAIAGTVKASKTPVRVPSFQGLGEVSPQRRQLWRVLAALFLGLFATIMMAWEVSIAPQLERIQVAPPIFRTYILASAVVVALALVVWGVWDGISAGRCRIPKGLPR